MRPVGSATSSRRDAPGVRDLALRVAGGRERAQPRDGDVLLGQRHEEALHAPRAADEDEQQPGRERVQRAGVAGLAHAEQPARGEREVVRGLPRRACRRGRGRPLQLRGDLLAQEADEVLFGHLGGEARRLAVPAAAAGARDDRDVDPAVGGAQRDLAPPAAAVGQLARERGDLGALDRAQVVDDALRVAVLGAREAEVVAREAGEGQRARRRSAARGPARAPAARAWRRACPRRGGGRCRGRRRPRR